MLCTALQQKRRTDVRFGSLADIAVATSECPLYPRKRTSLSGIVMSAMTPKADIAGNRRHVR